METCSILEKFEFTTSEAKETHTKHCIRVAKRLKNWDFRKLGNLRDMSKLDEDRLADKWYWIR